MSAAVNRDCVNNFWSRFAIIHDTRQPLSSVGCLNEYGQANSIAYDMFYIIRCVANIFLYQVLVLHRPHKLYYNFRYFFTILPSFYDYIMLLLDKGFQILPESVDCEGYGVQVHLLFPRLAHCQGSNAFIDGGL